MVKEMPQSEMKNSERKRDYGELLAHARILATENAWKETVLGELQALGKKYPIVVFELQSLAGLPPKVNISAGVHGDEPAGPATALKLLEALPHDPTARALGISLVICENPTGYELHTRENWRGIDLNREWRESSREREVSILRSYVETRTFQLSIELHEDIDTHGFYLYELFNGATEKSFGSRVVQAVQQASFEVNFDTEIDGHPALHGIVHPKLNVDEMPGWPKSIFVHLTHLEHNITLETAPALPLETRVAVLQLAIKTCLDLLSAEK